MQAALAVIVAGHRRFSMGSKVGRRKLPQNRVGRGSMRGAAARI